MNEDGKSSRKSEKKVDLLGIIKLLLLFIIIMLLQPFVGPWPLFQFLDPQDSLDGGSVHRKAATYTQNNTNTE
jgi:hypothetical protein